MVNINEIQGTQFMNKNKMFNLCLLISHFPSSMLTNYISPLIKKWTTASFDS